MPGQKGGDCPCYVACVELSREVLELLNDLARERNRPGIPYLRHRARTLRKRPDRRGDHNTPRNPNNSGSTRRDH
jgi:hypothetical protein